MRGKKQASSKTRRDFLESAALGLTAQALLAGKGSARPQTAARPAVTALSPTTTDSDVGSLFPFIQSQAPSDFKLSFLRPEYKSVSSWKKVARGKLLELLHYSPPKCDPRAETVEKIDCGEYVREKVYFNTTPDIRVPAFVLIPKNAPKPAPAIVALHDHGGFYLWGKEKIVDLETVHPVLAKFKETSYSGKSIASDLARQGYVVIVIDMFYWGERRLLLDDDCTGLAGAPCKHHSREDSGV